MKLYRKADIDRAVISVDKDRECYKCILVEREGVRSDWGTEQIQLTEGEARQLIKKLQGVLDEG